jgi:alpha-glucosidase
MGAFLPPDAVLRSGDNPLRLLGRWPVMWAKLHREAIREAGRSADSVFISRCGWAGSARHSVIASTGEHHASFGRLSGMRSSLTASLSLACSGMGLSAGECGGGVRFLGSRSKELLMRWHDYGAFTPIFRARAGDSLGWQPDSDEETLGHFVRMTRVHRLLSPYIRGCVKENASLGLPVMRPLFMQFPEEEKLKGVQDCFMLGGELLVAPILSRGQKHRKLCLPEGRWVELWNGKTHSGGELICSAPFGKPPAFFREDGKNAEVFTDFERRLKD